MKKQGHGTVEDFRGLMSMEFSDQPEQYERLQYIKVYSGLE
jgi:dihydroorotate dehydrogenase (fumarate)